MSHRNRTGGHGGTRLGAVAPRASGSRTSASAAAVQGGRRVSATVVLIFIFTSTVISIYDLYLLLKLMAH